jgi:hypothetical protein
MNETPIYDALKAEYEAFTQRSFHVNPIMQEAPRGKFMGLRTKLSYVDEWPMDETIKQETIEVSEKPEGMGYVDWLNHIITADALKREKKADENAEMGAKLRQEFFSKESIFRRGVEAGIIEVPSTQFVLRQRLDDEHLREANPIEWLKEEMLQTFAEEHPEGVITDVRTERELDGSMTVIATGREPLRASKPIEVHPLQDKQPEEQGQTEE